jgi:hypothetical protein
LDTSRLSRIDSLWRLGLQSEVLVVEGYHKVLFLVERVLELDTFGFSWLDSDRTLRLWWDGFTIQHASVLNAFRRGEFEHTSGVANCEWLVFDCCLKLNSLIVLGGWCGNLSHFSLEVRGLIGLVHTFNLDSIVSGLLHEMSEFEVL